jgi:selenocysteine-specific elongation factor
VTTLTTDPSSTLDVLVEISARRAKHNSRAQPLKNNSMVDVHHGTSRVPAKLLFLEGDSLAPGAGAFAQLRLSAPLFSFLEDRLVLRDRSQQNTIGGGIVLDPDARRESFRLEAQRAFLKARASRPGDVTIAVKSQIARDKIADVSTLLLKSPFSPASVRAAVHTLQKSGEITLLGDVAVESSTWQTLRERAAEIVDRFHAKDPDLPGLDLNAFHAAFPDLSSALFDSFVQDLCRADFVQKEHFIARREHQTVLPPSLEAVAVKIREMLAANPFDPPTRNRIAPDQSARQALRFLISEGLVTEISPELVLLRTAFDRMTTLIRDFLTKHGTATVSQIREELRTSRRVLVPLLEFLDGQKITRRIGDQRILAD